jgi:hypothetical protein
VESPKKTTATTSTAGSIDQDGFPTPAKKSAAIVSVDKHGFPTRVKTNARTESIDKDGFPTPVKKRETKAPTTQGSAVQKLKAQFDRKQLNQHDDVQSLPSMFQVAKSYCEEIKIKSSSGHVHRGSSKNVSKSSQENRKPLRGVKQEIPCKLWNPPKTPPVSSLSNNRTKGVGKVINQNSLDILMELPDATFSPSGGIRNDEDIKDAFSNEKMPFIDLDDEVSEACSEISSIFSISEHKNSDFHTIESPRQRQSSCSVRSYATRDSRYSKLSVTSAPAGWQLREQLKHQRRTRGRVSITATNPSPGRQKRYSGIPIQSSHKEVSSPRSVVRKDINFKSPDMKRRMMCKGEKERLCKESNNRKNTVATSVLSFGGFDD